MLATPGSTVSPREETCALLSEREKIDAEEITDWPILEDQPIFIRGESEILTRPIVELGRAITSLVVGALPTLPVGMTWLYGPPGAHNL